MTAVLERTKTKGAPRCRSYEDYCALDDDRRHELHEGELVPIYPGPDFDHQTVSLDLAIRMKTHADTHKLGTVIIAPFDVVFDAHNTARSDGLFVAKARTKLIQPRGVFGAPDLVVEVVSPSSVSHDRSLKRKLYARFGMKEF